MEPIPATNIMVAQQKLTMKRGNTASFTETPAKTVRFIHLIEIPYLEFTDTISTLQAIRDTLLCIIGGVYNIRPINPTEE